MSDAFTSVWDEAGRDAEAEQSLRALTSARVQVAPYWGFLAAAESREDFVNRLALKEVEIDAAAQAGGVTFEALARSLAEDFHAIEVNRKTASDEDASQHLIPVGHRGILHSDHGNVTDAQGRTGFYATVTAQPDRPGGPHKVAIEGHGAQGAGSVGTIHTDHHFGWTDQGAPHTDLHTKPGEHSSNSAFTNEYRQQLRQTPSGPRPGGDPRKQGVRTLAIFKITAADKTAAYYVVDEEADEKVGGPYDTEADARDAIEGGDVSGSNLKVEQGGGDSGDSDDGDDKDSSDDSGDKDDSDDDGGNPFAKKESAKKTAQHVRPDWVRPEQHEWYDRGVQSQRNEFKSGLGSYEHDTHQMPAGEPSRGNDWRPHRVYDSINSLLNHQGRFAGSSHPEEHRDNAQAHATEMAGFNHCPSCDHAYSTMHPDHVQVGHKDQCPNCGDTDHHETVADVLSEGGHYDQHHERTTYSDDHGPDYHGLDGDNYGDPYGRHDRHIEASLFPVIALEDGVDPLDVIVQSVPSGNGEPEKADEHSEHLDLTGSLVDSFRQVFTAHVKA